MHLYIESLVKRSSTRNAFMNTLLRIVNMKVFGLSWGEKCRAESWNKLKLVIPVILTLMKGGGVDRLHVVPPGRARRNDRRN